MLWMVDFRFYCTIIGCSYDRCVAMVLKPTFLQPARLQHVDLNCKILFKHTSCCLCLDPYPSAEFRYICFTETPFQSLGMISVWTQALQS